MVPFEKLSSGDDLQPKIAKHGRYMNMKGAQAPAGKMRMLKVSLFHLFFTLGQTIDPADNTSFSVQRPRGPILDKDLQSDTHVALPPQSDVCTMTRLIAYPIDAACQLENTVDTFE